MSLLFDSQYGENLPATSTLGLIIFREAIEAWTHESLVDRALTLAAVSNTGHVSICLVEEDSIRAEKRS